MAKAKTTSAKSLRLSFRVSESERAWLEKQAGQASVSSYVRHRLFGHGDFNCVASAKTSRPRKVRVDRKVLAQILALLGRTSALHHLSSLSNAARSGSLVMTPEAEAVICSAHCELLEIKSLLVKALGIWES